ncbi:MFS transporter, partial [Micrococcus sp. SIMBA_131]
MLTAIVTGVLISLAMTIASEAIPVTKRGVAISFVFGGFTMANVVGVPTGTVIAEWYRWDGTFLLAALLGVVGFVASFLNFTG